MARLKFKTGDIVKYIPDGSVYVLTHDQEDTTISSVNITVIVETNPVTGSFTMMWTQLEKIGEMPRGWDATT